jgi:hypothetical protein
MAIVELHLHRDQDEPDAFNIWVDGTIGDDVIRFQLDTGGGACTVPRLRPCPRWEALEDMG